MGKKEYTIVHTVSGGMYDETVFVFISYDFILNGFCKRYSKQTKNFLCPFKEVYFIVFKKQKV